MMWVVVRGSLSPRKTWLGGLLAGFGRLFRSFDEVLICTNSFFSLAEAQRITSVYAKMEYGVKRLLWLGG